MKTPRIILLVLPILCLGGAAVSLAVAEQLAPGNSGVVLLPPDFYNSHREALGMSEDQLREMQRIAEESFRPAEGLQAEMRKRNEALREVIARHPANPDEAAERFRQVLEVEHQIKAMQLLAKVAMRNILSAEQFEKLKQLVAKYQARKGDNVTAGLKEKFEQLKQEIKRRAGGGEPPRELVGRLEQIERAARDGRVKEAEQQVDVLLRQLRGAVGGKESGQIDKGDIQQQLQKMEEALKNTINPEQRERIQQRMRELREAQGSGNGPEGARGQNGEGGGIRQQIARMEEALKNTSDPEQRERIQRQMSKLREMQESGKGPEGAQRKGGEGLEQHLRRIAEAAERADNPEVRERLQAALGKLREAAASGNQEVVGNILKAIKPLLHDQGQNP